MQGWALRMSGRSMRRYLFLLTFWGVSCYVVFNLGLKDATSRSYTDGKINTRILLQKVIETRAPTPTTEKILSEIDLLNLEPLLDQSGKNDSQRMVELQKLHPNIPIQYWMSNKNKHMYINKTCAKYPSLYELAFDNSYWQTMDTRNGTFQLYGAYYDIRSTVMLRPVVRILGMVNRIVPTVKTFCHLWFDKETHPVIIPVMEYKYMWVSKWGNYKQGIYQPYLISCRVPSSHTKKVPVSVSLVQKPCDTASNNLRVIYNKQPVKDDFAVCVKGLDFPDEDLSVKMVEWMELLKILGASKLFLYELEVHPNISKVLKYYQEAGFVELTPITLPGGQPNLKGIRHLYLKNKVNNKRQNELIPYNDCLYKNMYRFKYLVLLDVDEVIMPVKTRSWRALMDDVEKLSLKVRNSTRASYNVRNVYFLDDLLHQHGWFKNIPKYMHMLQHVYRSRNFTKPGQYVKCFHNPEKVLTLHNHFPLACLGGGCTSYPINTTDAQLQHYRRDCVKTLKKSCSAEYRNHTTMDTLIWRYREELVSKVSTTLYKLGFFPTDKLASTGSGSRVG